MRNLSSRPFSVRPLAAALLLGGAALVISEAAAPAPAHAVSRTATVTHGGTAGGFGHPGVLSRRLTRPNRGLRVRPQRRLRPRASRSGVGIRPRVTRVIRPLIPLTDPVWERLRRCESGGRYNINTGNGFYGAYQFVPSTWRGLGFPGMPHQAPPNMQDEAAQKLQARSGWGQWPACTRKLGLR